LKSKNSLTQIFANRKIFRRINLETPFKNVQSFSERQKFRLENHLAYFFFFIALMFEGKKRKDFMKTTITVLAIIFCITIINSTAGR